MEESHKTYQKHVCIILHHKNQKKELRNFVLLKENVAYFKERLRCDIIFMTIKQFVITVMQKHWIWHFDAEKNYDVLFKW